MHGRTGVDKFVQGLVFDIDAQIAQQTCQLRCFIIQLGLINRGCFGNYSEGRVLASQLDLIYRGCFGHYSEGRLLTSDIGLINRECLVTIQKAVCLPLTLA